MLKIGTLCQQNIKTKPLKPVSYPVFVIAPLVALQLLVLWVAVCPLTQLFHPPSNQLK